jgi:hypothetical protein
MARTCTTFATTVFLEGLTVHEKEPHMGTDSPDTTDGKSRDSGWGNCTGGTACCSSAKGTLDGCDIGFTPRVQ